MTVKKITASAALVAGMILGSFGAGFAHAETRTLHAGDDAHFVQPPVPNTAPNGDFLTPTGDTYGGHGDEEVVHRGTVVPVHGDD